MMRYRGNIYNELNKDEQIEIIEVLDQLKEVSNVQEGLNNYGGVTYFSNIDKYISNYHEFDEVHFYTHNVIKLLIPDAKIAYDSLNLLQIIGNCNERLNIGVGYWISDSGREYKDTQYIVEFNTNNIEVIRLMLRKLSMIGYQLKEECMACYINDALLLIK